MKHYAGRASELQEGEIKPLDVGGLHLVLVRRGEAIYCLEGYCTHEDFDLAYGMLLDDRLLCTRHLSQFLLETGEVLNPPAERPLKVYKVIREGDSLYVEVEE
jgi:nitrite reductase/ring-hydroxylating ferredoxin subunit